MQFGVAALEEVGNDVRTLPLRMFGLEVEAGVFLVAFGREADVVELDLVHAGVGDVLSQSDVVFLDLGIRGVSPNQLAVLAPRQAGAVRLYGKFRMGLNQALVAE